MQNSNNISQYYNDFSRKVLLRDFSKRNLRQVALKEFCKKNVNKKSSVLEVGCGVGILTKYLTNKCSKIVAIDISPENIEVAKKYNKSKNVEFHVMNICEDIDLLLNQGPFNVIIMPDVIEHIQKENYTNLFNDITKLLSIPNSKVLLTYPSPHYQDFLKETNPDSMQLIDETVNLEEILLSTELRPVLYKQVNVWLKRQYVHLILESRQSFDAEPPKVSAINIISRKLLGYYWFARNYLFNIKLK